MKERKNNVLTFRPSNENFIWLRKKANEEDRSMNWVVNKALAQARINHEEQEKDNANKH